MSRPMFRAKYVVVLNGGREVPVLLPPAAGPDELPKDGRILAGGLAELHTLGGAEILGFTVAPWAESGLRCRDEKDVQLLDHHWFNETPLERGQPFTTRPQ